MWGVRRWLALPSHFPLVLLEPRGRKEGGMKERQLVEVQELSGEVQMRPVSREAEQPGPKKVWKWREI